MNIDDKKNKKLVLVDGSSYLFRAYHALPPLTNSKGMPTGAVYGVLNMLRRLMQDEKPDFVAVIFDTKAKNFRHQLYEAYKANRTVMPDELQVQIAPLHKAIRAMGLPLIAIEGYEADDIIGTLALHATNAKWRTVISTGDKDMAQLVNESVVLVNTMTSSVLDEKNVLAKFGVAPKQIVDYLTLVGDPVDNVPGIPKVGPKTAAKWLQEYETLDNLVNRAQEIKGKVGEYLRENLSTLPLSKQLVTIVCDVPLDVTIESLVAKQPEKSQLREVFEELELKSWLKELDKEGEGTAKSAETENKVIKQKSQYQCVTQTEVFLEWIDLLAKAAHFVIDTETTSLDPMQAELVGIALAINEGQAIYIPLAHDFPEEEQLSRDWVLNQLKPILENPAIGKIGQHLKYDMHIFARYDIYLTPVVQDTMLESYVYNSVATRHDMDSLAQKYLNVKTISYEEVAGKGAKQVTFDKVGIQAATEYAAEDADITLALHHCLYPKLEQESSLLKVYQEIELPLVPVLFQMEEYGVRVDADKLNTQSEQIAKELQALEEQATLLAGETFNLGSPKQLQTIFYEKLQLPILERTPTGAPSTAESVLQELSHDYELPKVILAHRTLSKLKSTYTDKLPLLINPNTSRIHTSYHQAVTATGRLSSSDPNLQNIPIRTQEGRKIRQAFIPAPGYDFIAADYSQIELRIMAHLSQDEGLLKAFCDGQDIHRFTAAEIFAVSLEEVTFEQRRGAKAINFGLIYGMSAFGLAKQLDIDRSAAAEYMEKYFQRYPGVKNYMDNIRKQAEQSGYVETLFGRRLYLPDIRAKNIGRKRAAERTAINAPMQGTAADIIKKAMIALHQRLGRQDEIKMLMQVHDELVFEVKQDCIEKAQEIIRDCMQHTVTLSVPLIVDVGVGQNWDEAH
ncbi:DNA polymerase I [Candidatus Berkiella aquae]|uniref:DNA polymerase I n=1 Tax=Candidatus Berkiella aquae TaxID=295108 RepID=A0A0Q9YMP8_9GAMM|nr:DNA polymerase I [Candidatus Berkiella aquae]MCS5712736.1 DNA polymerase I [Candidatus Berkiella aquae]